MPKIEIITKIRVPIEVCFDLSRSIDLHQTSVEHTGEQAIAGVTSGLINLHETVTWRAKHLGVWQTLTTKITAMEKPNFFADEMVKGAFHSFRHEHHFHRQHDYTLIIDIFNYTAPFGMLGRLADKLFLKSYMRKLLEKRNEVIKHYAESDQWKKLLPHDNQSD